MSAKERKVAWANDPRALILFRTDCFALLSQLVILASLTGANEVKKKSPQASEGLKVTTSGPLKVTTSEAQKVTTLTRGEVRKDGEGVGVEVLSRVLLAELKELLIKKNSVNWCSSVRLNGLLLLIASAEERLKGGCFTFSRDRERSLCSPLSGKLAGPSPRWPVAVLERVGVFRQTRAAATFPRMTAREFAFGPMFAKRHPRRVRLSLGEKGRHAWEKRGERLSHAFERRHRIIETVRTAAGHLRFSEEGMKKIIELRHTDPNKEASTQRCYDALRDGPFETTLDRQGTLHSPVSGCPRLVRPFLLLDGFETCEMDISGAHLVVLVRIYEADFLRRLGLEFSDSEVEAERKNLIEQIQSGDVYGGDGPERKRRKRELLTALNIKPKIQRVMKIARKLLSSRPILALTMNAVKRKDHCCLSWWLQRWVSEIVNPAVLRLAERDIPGVPIVDSILCRKRDSEAVRQELLDGILRATGIVATVGGSR